MTNLTEYVRSQLIAMATSIESEANWIEERLAKDKEAYDRTQDRISKLRAQAAELRTAAGKDEAA